MKTDEQRRDDIRDEMLIDIARGMQVLLAGDMVAHRGSSVVVAVSPLTVIGRLEGHIGLLKGAK